MTFTLSPWLVIIGAWLMLFGAWFLGSRTWPRAWAAAGRLLYWLRWDRVSPLLEDDDGISKECANGDHGECEGCWCSCGHDIDLPPERSAAALGFERERRAPPWEAFQRLQYEAMGFEFPSGLMARVRELTP